jgi:hypothetical protein
VAEIGRRRKLASGATIDVSRGKAWVEGSVPKARTGVNYPSASVETAVEVCREWMVEASEFVSFESLPRVNRLDIVRDFDVSVMGLRSAEVLSSVAQVPVTLRATKAHYRDPTEKQAQTVMVRTKRGGAGRLYDKAAESGLESASNVVRFEAQERTRPLRAAGLLFLSDLYSVDLDGLGRDRMSWCGFAEAFSPLASLFHRVWSDETLTEGQRLQLAGFYAMGGSGLGITLQRSRLYRLRRLAERFGYPSESSFRLDWDQGLVAA